MTTQQFVDAYLPTAERVSAGTGIDPFVLLAQWANETAWGRVVVGCNLGNIRDTPHSFAHYPNFTAFADACIATWHNGYYPGVLAAKTPQDQLAAICASPWSSGHYGGSLQSFYAPLEAFDLSFTDNDREIITRLFYAAGGPGSDAEAKAHPLATRADVIAPVAPNLTALIAAVATLTAKVDVVAGNVATISDKLHKAGSAL